MTAQLNPMYIFNSIEEKIDIEMSPSQILKQQVCFRALGYYRARIKPMATPQNLVFGSALHWVIEGYIKGFISEEDMSRHFKEKFHDLSVGNLISMAKSKSREVSEVIGQQLASSFPAHFKNLGLKPVVIEGAFKVQIAPHTFLKMVIDFVGIAEKQIICPDTHEVLAEIGDTVILDWKTAAVKEGRLFARYGIQLTFYWAAVLLACEQWGIRPPKLCGFASGIKPTMTKVDSKSLDRATWAPIEWTKRTQSDIDEAFDYARYVAARLRRGEFFRETGAAYNSPCDSQSGRCDYAGLCLEGSVRGYKIPDKYQLMDLI